MNANVFVEQVARKISQMGLSMPAILLLEAHKPVAFLGSQLAIIAQPALEFFLPRSLIQNTVELLADADQIEHLIVTLERGSGVGEKQ